MNFTGMGAGELDDYFSHFKVVRVGGRERLVFATAQSKEFMGTHWKWDVRNSLPILPHVK